jgi:hypothetical protein
MMGINGIFIGASLIAYVVIVGLNPKTLSDEAGTLKIGFAFLGAFLGA